jgi:hypothetical protein
MSFPTIVSSPSVSMDSNSSTHIQIATEFSYTFSNSGVTPPGSNELPPTYEAYPSSLITFSNTGSYSPTNTLVTSTPPNLYINFNGQTYYTPDIATDSVFTFQIPYTPVPPSGNITLGKQFDFFDDIVDDAVVRYIDAAVYTDGATISLTKRSDGNFLITYPTAYELFYEKVSDAVGSSTYITYTTSVNHGLFVGQTVTIDYLVGYDEANVSAKQVASIPTSNTFTVNVAGAGTTSISGQEGSIFIQEVLYSAETLSLNANIYWDSPQYQTWDSNASNYFTGSKVFYEPNGLSYESLSSSGFYGDCNSPVGIFNFQYWWPVSTDLSLWSPFISYTIGDRVLYIVDFVPVVYKSVIDINLNNNPFDNTDYWTVSDTNYSAWNSSTEYSPTDRVIYNSAVYQSVTTQSGNIPGNLDDNLLWIPTAALPNPATTFTLTSPNKIVFYPAIFPTLTVSGQTSNALLPLLAGSGSDLITFGTAGGFQSMPTETQPLKLTILQSILGVQKASSNFYITVDPFTISVDPPLISPLSLVTYQPFGLYTYSIPDNLVNVALKYNSNVTSTSLIPFITNGETQYSLTFGSAIGLTSGGTTTIRIDAELNGNTILFSNLANIITTPSVITITPAIPTGSLSLFKFEPFTYLFTTESSDAVGLSFRVSRSSPDIIAFTTISEDLQSVTFEGSFSIAYSTPLSLIVDLMYGTTIVDTRTILITVGQGRFFPPTANQNFQLFQYEDVSNTFGSNPSFITALPITSIISVPSLPSGLSFGGSCNTFFLQGTPILRVNQSNYQIIGSNSSNGKIVTSIISIRVNEQLVRITPSTSTLSNLTVDTAITPITSTAVQPPTIYYSVFNYTWSGLPDGFTFQNNLGSNVSQPFTPSNDPSLTIILAGAPSLAFATSLSTSPSNLYQTRLVGTRTDQTGKQIVGSSLFNFSMAETVLINVSNSVTLYRSKPLGTTDVLITAGSFFSTATITSITANSLPPGLTIQLYSGPNIYRLSGTPTEVNLSGSYTFTATNTNGTSRSVTATIPINPNIVTFGGSTPINGSVIQFIVSRPLTSEKIGYYTTPIIFSATSTANATPIIYTSSIDFTVYGLTLNSTSGTLTGIPTTSLSSTTVTITATDSIGTIGTTTIQLSILPDTFSWSTYTPTYFQNRAITPFQFLATSTLSERLIQSYSSTNLPTGLVISASGLLTGTPTTSSSGSFTITATTGYSITNQVYSYSMIADQLMIIQANGTDTISSIFSGIQYRAIEYSSDSFVNATFSIGTLSPATSATIAVTSGGLVSGDFTTATLNTTYSVTLTAVFGTVTATTTIYILFTTSGSGTINIPTELSTLTFSEPTQTSFTLFEYVPYSIPIKAIGSASFIYYFSSAIPLGFEFLKDSSGLTATLSGISPTIANQGIVVYAKTAAGYPVSTSITLRTITPFFINPQSGASAYTAILRNDVLGNAAQNARDNRTFPEVNPLAGPLMAPRAPDVVTPDNCILNLCKKPCPTCHTMM